MIHFRENFPKFRDIFLQRSLRTGPGPRLLVRQDLGIPTSVKNYRPKTTNKSVLQDDRFDCLLYTYLFFGLGVSGSISIKKFSTENSYHEIFRRTFLYR